jgi:hypothetical protein
MHIDRTIAGILGVIFPFFTLWCLSRAFSERIPTAPGAAHMLRFGRTLRILWFVCMVLLVVGFSSDIFLGKVRPDESTQFWLTFGGFALLFGGASWFVVAYRVEYDDQCIVVHLPWGQGRRIEWAEVISVKYVKGSGIVITVQGQKREVITSLISGSARFIEDAQLRLRA